MRTYFFSLIPFLNFYYNKKMYLLYIKIFAFPKDTLEWKPVKVSLLQHLKKMQPHNFQTNCLKLLSRFVVSVAALQQLHTSSWWFGKFLNWTEKENEFSKVSALQGMIPLSTMDFFLFQDVNLNFLIVDEQTLNS